MLEVEYSGGLVGTALKKLTGDLADYWSYSDQRRTDRRLTLFQYPAMMVPEMLEDIIRAVIGTSKRRWILMDPFMGSGTTLSEAMRLGLDYVGRDINPLAVLISDVKRGPFHTSSFDDAVQRTLARYNRGWSTKCESQIENVDKWYTSDVQVCLSRFVRAIRAERSIHARRFLWVALAETARLVSNSRTSTYKLHIRSKENLRKFQPDVEGLFNRVVTRNLAKLSKQKAELNKHGRLRSGWYLGDIDVGIGDSRSLETFAGVGKCSFLVTSPPYGDNHTTIPYGQAAYLPLSWIDHFDIPGVQENYYLKSTHEIDARSLGGSKAAAMKRAPFVRSASASFAGFEKELNSHNSSQLPKVVAFLADYLQSVEAFMQVMRADSVLCLTVGDRRVAGKQVPLAQITLDFLRQLGFEPIELIQRRIHSKKMAKRNNVSATMSTEEVLILKRS